MKIDRITLCFVVLVAIGEAHFISAAEPSPIPTKFNAYVGGFMGASYSVELHDGILIYTASGLGHSNPKHKKITPTPPQWLEFRQTLDDLKVWQWRNEYPTDGTHDGTQWSLEIAYADRTLRSKGDNNYPDAAGKPNRSSETTKAFKRYLAAVQKLIGGETFK